MDGLYVADIGIPAEIYMPLKFSEVLPSREYFGINKGYWRILLGPDHLGQERSRGLLATVEFTASDLQDAEDKALAIGEKLGQLIALYGGSPRYTPLLRCLAKIGMSQGIIEQHVYFYLDDQNRMRQVEIKPWDFQRLLVKMGELPESVRDELELAIRWYVISLSPDNPTDGFLAGWIGFEAIGPMLSEFYHPAGTKAPCSLCGNLVGKNRNTQLAGIEHMIRRSAPELLDGRSIKELQQLRHEVAHSLKSSQNLGETTGQLLRPLQLALATGILTCVGRSGEYQSSFGSFLPREYEVRPDARASIVFDEELTDYQPYFGEWGTLEREFPDERSRLQSNGQYVWGAKTTTKWGFKGTGFTPEYTTGYVMFHREGMVYRDIGTEGPSVPQVQWRERNIPPSWKQLVEDAAKKVGSGDGSH